MATMTEALAEAYASAPQDVIVLHTLEINHRSFTQPARVVRWPVTGNEPTVFRCVLEDEADYDPGREVEFIGLPFELILPEISAESTGEFQIRVDNIGDALDEQLEAAVMHGGDITGIYRTFIKGQEADGPQQVWFGINVKSPSMEGQTITFSGSVFDWMMKAFGNLYRPEQYPALVNSR